MSAIFTLPRIKKVLVTLAILVGCVHASLAQQIQFSDAKTMAQAINKSPLFDQLSIPMEADGLRAKNYVISAMKHSAVGTSPNITANDSFTFQNITDASLIINITTVGIQTPTSNTSHITIYFETDDLTTYQTWLEAIAADVNFSYIRGYHTDPTQLTYTYKMGSTISSGSVTFAIVSNSADPNNWVAVTPFRYRMSFVNIMF